MNSFQKKETNESPEGSTGELETSA
jgi:hypothetical protein